MGWKCDTLAIGGLMYIGFSEIYTNKLVCISSQGQSVINCETLKKIYCDGIFDENDLTAYTEELGNEQIRIVGDGGGGLRHYSNDGNILERVSPFWPKEQIVFMPHFHSWYSTLVRAGSYLMIMKSKPMDLVNVDRILSQLHQVI